MKELKIKGALSDAVIEEMADFCAERLAEAETDRRDIERICQSLKEILTDWHGELGDAKVVYRSGSAAGRPYILFSVAGHKLEFEGHTKELLTNSALLSYAGLRISCYHRNGYNSLVLYPASQKKKPGQTAGVAAALVLAALLGVLLRFLPQQAADIAESIRKPLLDTVLSLFKGVAMPMVFLSVLCGILSMGDMSSAERIGKRTVFEFCKALLVITLILLVLILVLFYRGSARTEQELSAVGDIYDMVLNIVPKDIFSPFIDGNPLQIIFMSILAAVVLLLLGERVSFVTSFFRQLNEFFLSLMTLLAKLIPLVVFLSVLGMVMSEWKSTARLSVELVLMNYSMCIALLIVLPVVCSLRFRIGLLRLYRKLMPTFLVGFTTASSSTAYSTNLETCEKNLGVSPTLSGFAVSLGQVTYKPCSLISLVMMIVVFARCYGVEMSLTWIVTILIAAFLLSIAMPPIPGAGIIICSIFFTLGGIPMEALAVMSVLDMFTDFIVTGSNLTLLQLKMISLADGLEQLDRNILRE